MNGAEALIKTALGAGLDVCFANPGTTEMPLVAALDSPSGWQRDMAQQLLVQRHEMAAVPLLENTVHPYLKAARDLKIFAIDVQLEPRLARAGSRRRQPESFSMPRFGLPAARISRSPTRTSTASS